MHNLLQVMHEGMLVLAEFDYEPILFFSFDTTQERYSRYALKAYGLPQRY